MHVRIVNAGGHGDQADGSSRGFTLLEVLVVVAILIVLAAVLFPTIKSNIQGAKSIQCVGNLRQVGSALLAYAADHDGIIYFHYNSASGTTRWSDCLMGKAGGVMAGDNYLQGGGDVMVCPSVAPKSYKEPLTGYVYGCLPMAWPAAGTDSKDTAGFNWAPPTASRAVRLSAIERPSKYWLLTDTWSAQYKAQIYIILPSRNARVHLRHRGKANFLFADAHVEALGASALPNLSPNPIFNAFNEKNQPVEF